MMDKKNDQLFKLAATMPNEKNLLLKVASLAVDDLNSAVLTGNKEGAVKAIAQYDAVIWKMNGGTFSGCNADIHSPGNVVENYCQAEIGTIPKWGQKGTFVTIVNDMRVLVEFGGIGSQENIQFSFYAVDLDDLFISDTGYRSYFGEFWYGYTVEEAAKSILINYLKNERHEIRISIRDQLTRLPLPPVLALLDPPARRSPIDVPSGCVIVDVIIPVQKAFIVRKWVREMQTKQANLKFYRYNQLISINKKDRQIMRENNEYE